jgi:hypothetical protein
LLVLLRHKFLHHRPCKMNRFTHPRIDLPCQYSPAFAQPTRCSRPDLAILRRLVGQTALEKNYVSLWLFRFRSYDCTDNSIPESNYKHTIGSVPCSAHEAAPISHDNNRYSPCKVPKATANPLQVQKHTKNHLTRLSRRRKLTSPYTALARHAYPSAIGAPTFPLRARGFPVGVLS